MWQIHEFGLYVLCVALSGLALYKLLGPSYPWEVIQTDQYLSELVDNITQGIKNTKQTEIPIPDMVLSFPEVESMFYAKSGSVSDVSSVEAIDYNLIGRNKSSQVIELRLQLKSFQIIFQQYTSTEYNTTYKGKIVVTVGKNVMKTLINCVFVKSCVCEPVFGPTIIDDMSDISVSVTGAEDDSELTNKITNWVINHLIGNVKPIVETFIEESIKHFVTMRHLKCV